MKLPNHLTLQIEHNEHKNVYEPIEDFILETDLTRHFENPEEMAICIKLDELWIIRWYPDTPVGFYLVAGSTLEKCLELANRNV